MIPDHLLRKAAQAALVQGVYGEPDSDDLLDDMHPADLEATLDTTRAALEAVAAEIWAQGWTAGYLDGTIHPGNPFEVAANPYIKEDR